MRSTSTSGSCKIELYPAEVPAKGIYADVDATHAFDFTLARSK